MLFLAINTNLALLQTRFWDPTPLHTYLFMINYFRKLISGYTLEKKIFRGQEFRFRFQGKAIFFDPVQMIQEYHNRKANPETYALELSIDRSKLDPFLPEIPQDILPSVICEGKLGNKNFEVSRYTFKRGIQPLSLYRFVLDGQGVGDFYRIYDYGSETQNFILKMASLQGDAISLSQESVIWKNNFEESVFIEKFGHTQIWNWSRELKL